MVKLIIILYQPVFQGLQPQFMRGEYDLHALRCFHKMLSRFQTSSIVRRAIQNGFPAFLFLLKKRLGVIATSRRQKAQRAAMSGIGPFNKPAFLGGSGGTCDDKSRSLPGLGRFPNKYFVSPLRRKRGECEHTRHFCRYNQGR